MGHLNDASTFERLAMMLLIEGLSVASVAKKNTQPSDTTNLAMSPNLSKSKPLGARCAAPISLQGGGS
jgi:hypothetical protein